MSDSNIPIRSETMPRFGLNPGLLLLLIIVAMAFVMIVSGCEEKSVVPIYADDHIGSYIVNHHIGKELFRTEGLFPSSAHVRPTDPGAVYREFVESSSRRVDIVVTEDASFGAPYNDLDFAEMTVQDQFRIRTERTVGSEVDTSFDLRSINRFGLFWRLNVADQDYGGWVLHGFKGTLLAEGSLDGRVIETGDTFVGDSCMFCDFRYLYYRERREYDSAAGRNVIVVDTLVGSTTRSYQPLESAPIIEPGHSIAFAHTDFPSPPVYELMTVVSDSASVIRVMKGSVDTLTVPDNDPGEWNLILFRTYLYPDRWRDAWILPYRTAGN